MKLNIYLLRDDIDNIEAAFSSDLRADKFEEARKLDSTNSEIQAYIECPREKTPPWADFLRTGFEVSSEIKNTSNGAIVHIKTDNRSFIITFGYAHSAIDSSRIVPDFGLKVVLNTMESGNLRTIETRRNDRATRQTKAHLSTEQPISAFGIETSVDWLRAARGELPTKDKDKTLGLKGSIEGSDSVRINTSNKLHELPSICRALLERYQTDHYKKHFAFIDHLRPLRNKDPICADLDQKVANQLLSEDYDNINIAFPTIPSNNVDRYKIFIGRRHEHVDDLTVESVVSCLRRLEKKLDDDDTNISELLISKKIKVIALDQNDGAASTKNHLWHYLVAHIDEGDNKLFVLNEGTWFQTERSYVKELRDGLASLPNVSNDLELPPWTGREDEYNLEVSRKKGYALLDKKIVNAIEGERSQLEVADLVSPAGDFIHVKRMERSATMSHLFAQALVSTTLYRTHTEYRKQVEKLINDGIATSVQLGRVVLGIGTNRDGDLIDNLFFFSLVNLSLLRRQFEAMDVPLCLCRIETKP